MWVTLADQVVSTVSLKHDIGHTIISAYFGALIIAHGDLYSAYGLFHNLWIIVVTQFFCISYWNKFNPKDH